MDFMKELEERANEQIKKNLVRKLKNHIIISTRQGYTEKLLLTEREKLLAPQVMDTACKEADDTIRQQSINSLETRDSRLEQKMREEEFINGETEDRLTEEEVFSRFNPVGWRQTAPGRGIK